MFVMAFTLILNQMKRQPHQEANVHEGRETLRQRRPAG